MITLSSDLGGPYPAAMKGVILTRTDAYVVDVSHDFPRGDVRTAAFWLGEVLPYFPSSVHVAVVDPDVGTDRAALAVRAGGHILVGPDNGVLLPAARSLATDEDPLRAYRIDYERFDVPSQTFHGRDVFAPAAAELHANGVGLLDSAAEFTRVEEYETVSFPDPDLGTPIRGEVLVVDGFGNAITNVPGHALTDFDGFVEVNGDQVAIATTYANVDPGDRVVTVGSHGNVELAVNRGSGADAFGVQPGSTVELQEPERPRGRRDV